MNIVLAILGAASAGSFLAIGSAANAQLKQSLQSPIAAAAINFLVGFSILTLLILVGPFNLPELASLANPPAWAFLGGFLGAIFVSLSTLTVPKLGLTTTTLAVVCSQMVMSLMIDQFGWFGVPAHGLKPARVVAIAFLLAAITLMQLDRRSVKH